MAGEVSERWRKAQGEGRNLDSNETPDAGMAVGRPRGAVAGAGGARAIALCRRDGKPRGVLKLWNNQISDRNIHHIGAD